MCGKALAKLMTFVGCTRSEERCASPDAYKFAVMEATSTSGNYKTQMKKDCKVLGMKPVCDHPNYCKSDKEALYIGQTHHMSHPSHYNNAAYMPSGFDTIKSKFKGMCYYTASHGGENALCNIPENTHAWLRPSTNAAANKFMCGKALHSEEFVASLGAKNGVPAQAYKFAIVEASSTSGNYKTQMVKDCKVLGMKPVCDHPNYCKSDKEALYIGQTHHMSHGSQYNNAGYMPSGFDTIKSKFKGMCYYTASHGGENALCNIPENTHAWLRPVTVAKAANKFVCAKVLASETFVGTLGAKNGVPAQAYKFAVMEATSTSGNYKTQMKKDCKALGMKPVCDHPNYCKSDKEALYIGQTHHMSHWLALQQCCVHAERL